MSRESRRPIEYPPPVDPAAEFIGPPTDPEDERIEVGVAIVGGGQAGTACAIRLLQLLEDDPELAESLGEVPVAVIEKGRVAGAHQLSGGVMNPASIRSLLPDDDSWPHFGEVGKETVYFMLNRKRAIPLKPTPPPFRNHGNYVVAVAELNRWLAEKAEEAGAYILSETVGAKLLVDDHTVVGVRTGDKGRDKQGGEKSNFEPGSDVVAKATVLAEGCWGHLTGAALKGLGLAGHDPQVWALGVKEVWEVDRPLDRVIHTLGWPLRPQAKYKEFGGSWIYPMNRESDANRVSLGFVIGLDYADARLSVHDVLQEFKLHPLVRKILAERQARRLGREGDPRGRLLGDAKVARARHGDLRRRRRHGQRAEAQGDPLRDPLGHARCRDDLPPAQGRLARLLVLRERGPRLRDRQGPLRVAQHEAAVREGPDRRRGDHQRDGRDERADPRRPLADAQRRRPAAAADRPSQALSKPDGKYTFDKLSGVFTTGNATRDDAPSHIRIQQHVPRPLAEAWAWMCPAGVYEVPEDAPDGDGHVELIVNPSNCVQCGAITAKGGRLTPPEGGDGPVYQVT